MPPGVPGSSGGAERPRGVHGSFHSWDSGSTQVPKTSGMMRREGGAVKEGRAEKRGASWQVYAERSARSAEGVVGNLKRAEDCKAAGCARPLGCRTRRRALSKRACETAPGAGLREWRLRRAGGRLWFCAGYEQAAFAPTGASLPSLPPCRVPLREFVKFPRLGRRVRPFALDWSHHDFDTLPYLLHTKLRAGHRVPRGLPRLRRLQAGRSHGPSVPGVCR